jgi:hypothetical protein
MSGARDEPLDGSSEPAPTPEFVAALPWRDLGDRIVLFDRQQGEEMILGGSGVAVWRLVTPRRSVAAVASEVAALLGDGTAEFGEAMAFIDELIDRGALRRE